MTLAQSSLLASEGCGGLWVCRGLRASWGGGRGAGGPRPRSTETGTRTGLCRGSPESPRGPGTRRVSPRAGGGGIQPVGGLGHSRGAGGASAAREEATSNDLIPQASGPQLPGFPRQARRAVPRSAHGHSHDRGRGHATPGTGTRHAGDGDTPRRGQGHAMPGAGFSEPVSLCTTVGTQPGPAPGSLICQKWGGLSAMAAAGQGGTWESPPKPQTPSRGMHPETQAQSVGTHRVHAQMRTSTHVHARTHSAPRAPRNRARGCRAPPEVAPAPGEPRTRPELLTGRGGPHHTEQIPTKWLFQAPQISLLQQNA